ncbi:phosphomannomutase SEC53 [Aspergillus alliaceus]|uniref:phosphomannomutase SEC53 n=1 Tax=Petromyces alliaceus TaxID=209559 RepID=UPI0012A4878E|nr:uncharacterized protein BDW43DRAFT_313712 [Aspergillus alliaceus]KAB8230674.1 hypothetical protein BDW43DRAFT_313712 [Aspergillus alliaceus]
MAAAAGAYPALEDRHVKDTFRLFDVEGTLTPARRTISLEMLQLLSQLRHNCTIGVVNRHCFPEVAPKLISLRLAAPILPARATRHILYESILAL